MSNLNINRNLKRNHKGKFVKTGDGTSNDQNVNIRPTEDSSSVSVSSDHSYAGLDEVTHEYIEIDTNWQTGRRLVELDILASGLKACHSCSLPIHLHNTVASRNFGLACVLDVMCNSCGAVNAVHTGRKHGKIYDMNTKLALGKYMHLLSVYSQLCI